jgi:Putative lumazine-binding
VWTILLPLLLSLVQDPEGDLPRHAMIGAAVEPLGGDSARAEILAVLDRMAKAMERRDTALLTSVFAPGARLVGMRPRDGGTTMQTLTVQQFAEFVANDKRDRWVERLHQPEVRIDGTLATVWAGYDFSFGTRRSHCGTDAFQLLRTGEGWKIVSLADTYRTEGCG